MKKLLILLTLSGALNLLNASTITATLQSVSPSLTVSGSFVEGQTKDIWSGQLNFNEFSAFCSNPYLEIYLNETVTYTTVPVESLIYGKDVAQVVSMYLSSPQDALNAAGAQWAIWSLIGGEGVSISPGQSTSIVAGQYLKDYYLYSPANVTFLSSPTVQGMVSFTSVPEPSTALTVFALGSFGLFINRKRNVSFSH